MVNSGMSVPDLPSLREDYQRILRNQTVDQGGSGTLLGDFEILLSFIGSMGIPVSGKYDLLPMKYLAQLNAQLTRPIEIDLKRPQ